MTKPDFFIVGAPKCGTSALCNYLAQHPEMFMSTIKEPYYFGQDLIVKRSAKTREAYLGLFETAASRLAGEASVMYLFSKTAAREIYNFNSDARVIAMLRNPVDAMYSLHSQLLYTCDEDIPDFERALAVESQRKQGQLIPRLCTLPQCLLYSEVFQFTDQLQRYFDVFSRARVHVIIYDDLKADPLSVYHQTLSFLGVNPEFHPNISVVNPNKMVRSKTILRALKGSWLRTGAKAILPSGLGKILRKRLMQLNTRYESRPPLHPEVRSRLQKKFAPEIERLSQLLDRDLRHWSQA